MEEEDKRRNIKGHLRHILMDFQLTNFFQVSMKLLISDRQRVEELMEGHRCTYLQTRKKREKKPC